MARAQGIGLVRGGDETRVAIQGPLVQYFEFQMKDFVQTMCCFKFLSKEVI